MIKLLNVNIIFIMPLFIILVAALFFALIPGLSMSTVLWPATPGWANNLNVFLQVDKYLICKTKTSQKHLKL